MDDPKFSTPGEIGQALPILYLSFTIENVNFWVGPAKYQQIPKRDEPVAYILALYLQKQGKSIVAKKPGETGVKRTPKRIVEEYLVACARLGDKAAQEQLVERYQRQFLAHAYRLLGNAEQAGDAVQEGWIDILRGLSKLRDDGMFTAWSYRIITRKCAREIKNAQKNREMLRAVKQEPAYGEMVGDGAGKLSDRQLLDGVMSGLSQEQRAAVCMFYLEDMSVAEIAVSLDIPAGTVKTRLMSARNKMRAALQGEKNGQA